MVDVGDKKMRPKRVLPGSVWLFLFVLTFFLLLLSNQSIFIQRAAAKEYLNGIDQSAGQEDPLDPETDPGKSPLAGIIVEKVANPTVVHYGKPVTYTFTVINISGQTVQNLQITDDLCSPVVFQGGDTNHDSLLNVGESWVYTCTKALTQDTRNQATVTGYKLSGDPVSDTDTAYVDVIRPELTVSKTPDYQVVQAGSAATFSVRIANSGDVALSGVVVSDPLTPACNRSIGNLPVGSSVSYDCSIANVQVGFTNEITATGTPPAGSSISQSDSAQVDVRLDGLLFSKEPDHQIVLENSSAVFTMAITNTSLVDLVNVQIADPLAPGCDRVVGNLASGESFSYACDMTAVSDLENVATVSASTSHGLTKVLSDTAALEVINPAVEIARTPVFQYVLSGDTAFFKVMVTNSGDSSLSDVQVTDPQAPDCDRTIGLLQAAEYLTYTCSLANVTSNKVLVAGVSGQSVIGTDVSNSVTTLVDPISPAVGIEKYPDYQQIPLGQAVAFTIVVTNSGDSLLDNVAVTDVLSPDCDRTIGSLAVDETASYICTVTNVTSDFINQATVSGESLAGTPVSSSDDAAVHALFPEMEIAKSVDPELTVPSLPVTYTIRITNTGDLTIHSVDLTDTLPAGLDYLPGWADPAEPDIVAGGACVWQGLGPLLPGESATVRFRAQAVPMLDGVFTNQVSARAATDGGSVAAGDDVDLVVRAPALAIEKKLIGADLGYHASNVVTFTVVITNTGTSSMVTLPLVDEYDPDILKIARATTSPSDMDNDGVLEWPDLTGAAPYGFAMDLEPDESFQLTIVFSVTRRTSVTTNTAIIAGAVDEFGNELLQVKDAEQLVDLPTAVDIVYFNTYPEQERVVLEWETAWEWNNWGFHIYRSATPRLSEAEEIGFVLGQGWGQLGGSIYRFVDDAIVPGEAYWYWLEDEDLQGSRVITSGPVLAASLNRCFLPLVIR